MFRKAAFVVSAALILGFAGSTFGQAGAEGWWSDTIGTAEEGKAELKDSAFEVTGNGADIWGNADAFHFMYKELTGDGSMTARVVSLGAGSNTWAKGGVMIRNEPTAGSEHAMMVLTANSDGAAGNGASFQWRATADGTSSNSDNAGAAIAAPYWVKIERVGNQFSAFVSADGQTWTQMGTAQTIAMADPVYVGLCVTSHAVGEQRTFTFDNVSLTGQVADRPPQLKAYEPVPASGSIGVATPLFSWTPGETAVLHDVYFGTTAELTEANKVASQQAFPLYFHVPGLEPGITYYWRIDEVDAAGAVHTGDVWTIMAMPMTAFQPSPANEAEGVFPGASLAWSAGQLGIEHQIYFGAVFSDVNDGTAAADKGKIAETTFAPGILRASTTYYWRIDEIGPDGSAQRGPVWSFTTEAGVAKKIVRQWWSNLGGTAIADLTNSPNYPHNPTGTELIDLFEGPVDWADNYGTRLYGWLTPPETGEYTFWISGDDAQQLWLSTDVDPANAAVIAGVAAWTGSREWEKEAGQKSAPISLQAGRKYFIQALGKDGGGGDSTAVAWQGGSIAAQTVIGAEYVDTFALPPLQAFSPSPSNGAVDAPQTAVLSWSAGEKAQEHEVYFGDDAAAVAAADVNSPLFKGRQAGATFDAGALAWNKTYYWRVDEVNAVEPESPWMGNVWSFTTADFIAVEDFESYTDAEGSRIYEAWIDGMTDGKSGSVVGYLEARNGTFGETAIVHGGGQSMPMDYNNVNAPFYSEATRALAAAQDWTAEGVDSLSLWFRGNPVSFVEAADGAIALSAGGADIWNNADEFRYAFKQLDGDGSITAKVDSVVQTDVWAKAGVMIRQSTEAGSTHAAMVVTPGSGVSLQRRLLAGDVSTDATKGGVTAPQWVRLTRTGDTFKAEHSADGVTWTLVGADEAASSVSIPMTGPVLIGLAVTSHNSNAVTTAQFSGVQTTGNVTGPWQIADVGVAQPGNDPAPLYVVVEDGAGKTAVAVHPDPQAVLTTEWTEWRVPLSSLAGVNLASVKAMSVGVGDRANPAAGGMGRIYIDDIRVVRPAPVVEEPNEVVTP